MNTSSVSVRIGKVQCIFDITTPSGRLHSHRAAKRQHDKGYTAQLLTKVVDYTKQRGTSNVELQYLGAREGFSRGLECHVNARFHKPINVGGQDIGVRANNRICGDVDRLRSGTSSTSRVRVSKCGYCVKGCGIQALWCSCGGSEDDHSIERNGYGTKLSSHETDSLQARYRWLLNFPHSTWYPAHLSSVCYGCFF